MSPTRKKGQVRFQGNEPMQLIEDAAAPNVQDWSPEDEAAVATILPVVKAYLKALGELSDEKYAHLKAEIPEHMARPGNALVVVCSDGVVVRLEKKGPEERRVVGTAMRETLQTVTSMLSQNMIHVSTPEAPEPSPEKFGSELKLAMHSPSQGVVRELAAANICFIVPFVPSPPSAPPSARPFRLFSVRNSLDVELHGELSSIDEPTKAQPFIARAPLRLFAGWDAIECYPGRDFSLWTEANAMLWAEQDLLGAVVVAQRRDAQLNSLDPRASTRRLYAAVLSEFKALLDSQPEREQILQSYLQSHPELLCPTHRRVWPKLAFGKHISDFVFLEATQEYLLVELERSTLTLFRQDGHQTAELTHAIGQLTDWKRYIEDNLATVQRELGLSGITSGATSLVVIGRSATLTAEHRRKLQAMATEAPRLRVLTYDDVYVRAKTVVENLLGPIWDPGGSTQIIYPPKL